MINNNSKDEIYGKILMTHIFSKYKDSIEVDNVTNLYTSLTTEISKHKNEISVVISISLRYVYFRHITKTNIPIVLENSEIFEMVLKKYVQTFNWSSEAPSNDIFEQMCQNFEYQISCLLDICFSNLLVVWFNSFEITS